MTRDYSAAITAALEHRNQQAALIKRLFDTLSTLEQTDPNHATFAVAAYGVVNAYRAARDGGAL